jgi:hypothetical protein
MSRLTTTACFAMLLVAHAALALTENFETGKAAD